MRAIKKVLFPLLLLGLASVSFAGDDVIYTESGGWIGKKQKGHYLDGSSWHYCFNDRGGSCGSVSLTTGHSACKSRGFNISNSFTLPQKIGGMDIGLGYNQSWTACNNRSETVTCSPNRGWKGRAVINFSERWGRLRVVGGSTYFQNKPNCPDGWKSEWMGWSSWRCKYNGGRYSRDGYLPEWRGSSCNYKRI